MSSTESGEAKSQPHEDVTNQKVQPEAVSPIAASVPKMPELPPAEEHSPEITLQDSPDKVQLRDWEILNAGPETKQSRRELPRKVKDIQRQVKERVMMLQPIIQGASRPLLRKLDQALQRTRGIFSDRNSTTEVCEIAVAVAMVFTGGRFSMSIACAQAFRMACWESLKALWKDLRESYVACSRQRNVEGVTLADVLRTVSAMVLANSGSEKAAATKRSLTIAKCADPNKIRDLFRGLWPGVVAVIATLRSRFAYAACLGTCTGQVVFETIQFGMRERLDKLSLDNKRWTEVGLQQSCGLVSVCLSFYATRIMNTLNAVLHGSTVLSKVCFQYVKSQQALPESDRSTIAKCVLPLMNQYSSKLGSEQEIVKWSIAVIGFFYQIRREFRFPLPMKVPLAPLYVMEYSLQRLASVKSF